MISRNEYLYTKSKVEQMENQFFEFENKEGIYKEWERYNSLADTQKYDLELKWKEYYKKCRTGYYGLMFDLAAEAFKQNDKNLLKSLVKQVTNSKTPYLTPPSKYDPEELKMKMSKYWGIKKECETMKELLREFAPVYDKKNADLV